MKQEDIDQAMDDLIEFYQIDFYEEAIPVIHDTSFTPWGYCDSISSARMDTLHILIAADKLSPEQLARIKKVDTFVLSHSVPARLEPLKTWLNKNHI